MKLEQAEIPLERDMFMRSLLQLTLRAYASDGVVVVEVINTGIGTPPGVNIFELFRSTKPNGSGIGLPVVAHILSAHKER